MFEEYPFLFLYTLLCIPICSFSFRVYTSRIFDVLDPIHNFTTDNQIITISSVHSHLLSLSNHLLSFVSKFFHLSLICIIDKKVEFKDINRYFSSCWYLVFNFQFGIVCVTTKRSKTFIIPSVRFNKQIIIWTA